MKIGIISSEGKPTLAAFYGEVWVPVPRALEALGMEPVNEMAAFIERYGDAVGPPESKDSGVGSERRAGRLHTPHKGRGLSAARARSAETLYCPRQQQLLCSGLQKSHLQAAGDGAALQLQPGGPQQRETLGRGFVGGGWNYEMVCVMGKACHNAKKEAAYDYVFGYTNMLDHSGQLSRLPL